MARCGASSRVRIRCRASHPRHDARKTAPASLEIELRPLFFPPFSSLFFRVPFSSLGRLAGDFRTTTNTTVNQMPSFNPNGTVTFPGTPTFTSLAGAPVILHQTVPTQLSPTPSYNLSFWISGEENTTNQGNTGVGIIGLRVTNVLPGNPIQWLAVPNSFFYGLSKLYKFSFTPINPLAPVEVAFINWGGMDLSAYGMSPFGTQPILDDVIINGAPEPESIWLLLIGALTCFALTRGRVLGFLAPGVVQSRTRLRYCGNRLGSY